MRSMQVVAIGGGEIHQQETLPIDRFIVRLTKKRVPRVLFIPTASDDSTDYIDNFRSIYELQLGCSVKTLTVANTNIDENIVDRVAEADVIYVGGGNTRKMMQRWESIGLDKILTQASHESKILCGLSAGAICWFESGFSDSERFTDDGSGWNYAEIPGLGLLSGMFCPHLDSENRLLPLVEYLSDKDRAVYASSDGTAVYSDGNEIHALTVSPSRSVFRIRSTGSTNVIRIERLATKILGYD